MNFPAIVDLITKYAIYSLDSDGKITSWNKGAELIKGWHKDEVIDRYFDFLYTKEEAKSGAPARNLQLAKDNGVYEEVGYRQRKDGTKFLADVTITPIYDEHSHRHVGYVKVVRDVTEIKQEEDDRNVANILLKREISRRKKIEKLLVNSNNELNTFASAASHDLQEPLRMVISYLQLLEKRYASSFDKDGREFLNFAIDGATRMKVLISDLAEYARIDTAAKPFKPIDTNLLLRQALNNLSVLIRETKADITHDELPVVVGEDVQIGRVFQNLLANAITFRSNRPLKIHIGVSEDDKKYIFSITDNGVGIEPRHHKDIFSIFRRIGRRDENSGSGSGLAFVKKIIDRHGGEVWLESEYGKGSTFYFSIPKATKRGA